MKTWNYFSWINLRNKKNQKFLNFIGCARFVNEVKKIDFPQKIDCY